MTHIEIYIKAKKDYIIKTSKFAYKNDPETFTRAFLDTISFPPMRSASNLERAIKDYLKYLGFQASKINVGGRFVLSGNKSIGMISALGTTKSVPAGKWIKSGSTKGISDLQTIIYGLLLAIEIKFSKSDRQRETQKKYQFDVEKSGGTYIIVKTFPDFLEQFDAFLKLPRVILMREFEKSNLTFL